MIYLDTHVVLWLYQNEQERISDRARTLIEEQELFVSPIVLLEMEYLYEIERITEHAERIFEYLQSRIGLHQCDLDFGEVIHKAVSLKWTRDPFDRIIIAHAIIKDIKLITKDDTIRKHYSRAVW